MSKKYAGDASDYGTHVRRIQDAGYTALLMSLGHRLGLFDAMNEANTPVTARQLAELTHMKERYIWEWLSGMAAAKIIVFDAEKRTFFIPEEHRFDLKIASGMSDAIGMFAHRHKKVEACFSKDGPDGISFNDDEYETAFWSMFSEMRRKTSSEYMDNLFLPSLKMTRAFEMLERGQEVIDAGCGSGELTIEFARRFPRSTFTGLDLCTKPLSLMEENATKACLENISTRQADIQNLPDSMEGTCDVVVMVLALHNLPDPLKALSQIRKVLRKDGMVLLFEPAPSSNLEDNIGDNWVSMLYTWSVYYCLPSSLSADPKIGYGACWGKQKIQAALEEQSFVEEGVFELPRGQFHLLAYRKSD